MASRPQPSELLGFRMGRLLHALRLKADEALRPQDFTMSQATVLLILDRRPGISSAELARILSVTPQAMGEKLAELEAAKLLQRRPDPANRRKLVADMTPAGRRKVATCRAAMGAVEKEMLAVLSSAERLQLEEMLDRCFRAIGVEAHVAPVRQAS